MTQSTSFLLYHILFNFKAAFKVFSPMIMLVLWYSKQWPSVVAPKPVPVPASDPTQCRNIFTWLWCSLSVPGTWWLQYLAANRFISPGPRVSCRASGHPGGATCCRITQTLREEVSTCTNQLNANQKSEPNPNCTYAHILSRFLLTNMKTGVFCFVKS